MSDKLTLKFTCGTITTISRNHIKNIPFLNNFPPSTTPHDNTIVDFSKYGFQGFTFQNFIICIAFSSPNLNFPIIREFMDFLNIDSKYIRIDNIINIKNMDVLTTIWEYNFIPLYFYFALYPNTINIYISFILYHLPIHMIKKILSPQLVYSCPNIAHSIIDTNSLLYKFGTAVHYPTNNSNSNFTIYTTIIGPDKQSITININQLSKIIAPKQKELIPWLYKTYTLDIHLQNSAKQDTLCLAFMNHSLDIAQFLINHGANINSYKDDHGNNLLLLCISDLTYQQLSFLLKHNFDITQKNKLNNSALDLFLSSYMIDHTDSDKILSTFIQHNLSYKHNSIINDNTLYNLYIYIKNNNTT
jgi:hypothetical protein